jgi:hypothetical protein
MYAKINLDVESIKGPFDWTIASFRSLEICLDPNFDPDKVLDSNFIVSSFARSAKCQNSELIFHHAIDAASLAKFGNFARGEKIHQFDGLRPIVEDAKGRFLHTFKTFQSLRSYEGQILFVRWKKKGNLDPNYPEAFEGESEASMLGVLKKFLNHDRFHILTVRSNIVDGLSAPLDEPIALLRPNGKNIECSINERKGWNGDQTNAFKGDEHSWGAAFDQTFLYLKGNGII